MARWKRPWRTVQWSVVRRPWPKGVYRQGQKFIIEVNAEQHPLDSQEIAMWPDGSLKWTAHSVSSHIGYGENYTVKGVSRVDVPNRIIIDENSSRICISTAIGLQVKFLSSGSSLLEGFSLNGHIVCSKADIASTRRNTRQL